jgi:flagellar basal body-associated protein FliL
MTMRAILILLILVVLVALAGVVTGFINVNQIRGAQAPALSATSNGIVAKGGQAPAFDVETGSVEVGTRNATVKMPSLEVKRPAATKTTDNQVNAM